MNLTTVPFELPDTVITLTPKEALVLRVIVGSIDLARAKKEYTEWEGRNTAHVKRVGVVPQKEVDTIISDLFDKLYESQAGWK